MRDLRELCYAAQKKGWQKRRKATPPTEKEVESAAKAILDEIPRRIEEEYAQGGHHLVVMLVPKDGWEVPPDLLGPSDPDDTRFLRGTSRAVYEACRKASLKPMLRFWADGSGNSGRALFIHW